MGRWACWAVLGLLGCPRTPPVLPPPPEPSAADGAAAISGEAGAATEAAPFEPAEAFDPTSVVEAPEPGAPPDVERVQSAVAWLLEEEGPPIRLRFFLPAPEASADPGFDNELAALAEAVRGAAGRLVRVDVSRGPHAEPVVTAMRGTGLLPRSGGEPDRLRALLVAVGDEFHRETDLAPGRGPAAQQLLLTLHRILRGPIQVGVAQTRGSRDAATPLLGVLADFALAPADARTDPYTLAALVVLAADAAPPGPGMAELIGRMLRAGRGVLVIGGARTAREGRARLELQPSAADPSALLAGTGLALEPGIVLDPSCARVSLPSGGGRLFLSYPPMPRTAARLPGGGQAVTVLPFASPVRIEPGTEAEVLAWSSERSWVEDLEADLDPNRAWRPPAAAVLAARPLIVAVRLPPSAGQSEGGRFCLVPTARFADAEGLLLEANGALLAGLVAWAADVEELLLFAGEEETP